MPQVFSCGIFYTVYKIRIDKRFGVAYIEIKMEGGKWKRKKHSEL